MLARCLALLLMVGLAARAAAGEKIDLPALLARLPASDRAEAEKVSKELVKGGKDTVRDLVLMLDGKEDAKARYALHGLALYTSRPGAEAERRAFSAALASRLDDKHSSAVLAFLLQQLQYVGGPEAIRPVAALLDHKGLRGPAAQALTRIGGPEAKKALRAAFADDKVGVRLEVVLALGHLRDREALGLLTKAAGAKDAGVRLASLQALGRIGDAGAAPTLIAAVGDKATLERARVLDACLELAERLHAEKQTPAARDFLDKLLGKVKDERGRASLARLRLRLTPDGGKDR